MATTTVTTIDDGHLFSIDTDYDKARHVTGSDSGANWVSGFIFVLAGQDKATSSNVIWQALVSWDTSSISDTDVIDSASVTIYGAENNTAAQAHTIEMREHAWGTIQSGIAITDWIDPGDLGSHTLLATISGGWNVSAQKVFSWTETGALDEVNKTGYTAIMMHSDRFRIGNEPASGVKEFSRMRSEGFADSAEHAVISIVHSIAPTLQSVAGVLSAVVSGVLTLQGQPSLGGALSSLTGTLVKSIATIISGALSAITGTLSPVRVFPSIVGGAISVISGTVSLGVRLAFEGTLTTLTSVLAKSTSIPVTGVLTSLVSTLASSIVKPIALGGALLAFTSTLTRKTLLAAQISGVIASLIGRVTVPATPRAIIGGGLSLLRRIGGGKR